MKEQPVQDKFLATVESDKFKQAVARVLPAHLTPERFIRIAITARMRTPKLAECDPQSVLQCLMQLSQFGLEPDGRHAHLIPFWNSKRNVTECQLIIDYKGLVALALRNGQIAYVRADKVCEHDLFEYNKGQVEKHVINFREDRGKVYAYYAQVRMKDGTEWADAMTLDDVKAIRARSRAKDSGPWVTDFDEMGKKTVFRRLSKWLPLSPEYRDALDLDSDALEDLRFDNATPVIERAKVPKISAGNGVQTQTLTPGEKESDKPDSPAETNLPVPLKAELEEPTGVNPKEAAKAGGQTTSPKKKPVLKRKKNSPSNDVPPFQRQMLERLKLGDRSPEDLLKVAVACQWCGADETWPLPEEKLELFLDSENWAVLMEEMDNLPPSVMKL